jgi:hypothetical protein
MQQKKIQTYSRSSKIKKIPETLIIPLTDDGPKIDIDVAWGHGFTPRALNGSSTFIFF